MAGTNETDDTVMTPLNLVVKLDRPAGGVSELGPAIAAMVKEGADRIGTLHEARFVQLDETTVMLLTTYDGDFDDYIFDFTKHLNDVFNLLLPNAIDPPPLPVEKDPQAFADWVRERNLPNAGGYYNAFPDLTVQDIRALATKVA